MKKDYFKISLWVSCVVHFSLFLIPALNIPLKPPPKYVEVSLIVPPPPPKPKPEPIKKKKVSVAKKTEVKTKAKPEAPKTKKVTAKAEAKPEVKKVGPVEISPSASKRLPVMLPSTKSAVKTGIPLPSPSFNPSIEVKSSMPTKETGSLYSPQKEKTSAGQLAGKEAYLSPKAGLAPEGRPSYEKGAGEEESKGSPPLGIKGPAGGRKILRQVNPIYPASAEKKGTTGKLELKFWVLPTGEVSETRVHKTSGWSEFDKSASQALRKWKFEPIKGEERQWGIISFIFRI
ncbi:MAG: TonB family protein [Candidatus Aerophobetes bacterium]|nr:TonB family protein [Candidatus Aerophobetes bacterium]